MFIDFMLPGLLAKLSCVWQWRLQLRTVTWVDKKGSFKLSHYDLGGSNSSKLYNFVGWVPIPPCTESNFPTYILQFLSYYFHVCSVESLGSDSCDECICFSHNFCFAIVKPQGTKPLNFVGDQEIKPTKWKYVFTFTLCSGAEQDM